MILNCSYYLKKGQVRYFSKIILIFFFKFVFLLLNIFVLMLINVLQIYFSLFQIYYLLLHMYQKLHSKNILFRDLKAANVSISKDGNSKISDFGLAK